MIWKGRTTPCRSFTKSYPHSFPKPSAGANQDDWKGRTIPCRSFKSPTKILLSFSYPASSTNLLAGLGEIPARVTQDIFLCGFVNEPCMWTEVLLFGLSFMIEYIWDTDLDLDFQDDLEGEFDCMQELQVAEPNSYPASPTQLRQQTSRLG